MTVRTLSGKIVENERLASVGPAVRSASRAGRTGPRMPTAPTVDLSLRRKQRRSHRATHTEIASPWRVDARAARNDRRHEPAIIALGMSTR